MFLNTSIYRPTKHGNSDDILLEIYGRSYCDNISIGRKETGMRRSAIPGLIESSVIFAQV